MGAIEEIQAMCKDSGLDLQKQLPYEMPIVLECTYGELTALIDHWGSVTKVLKMLDIAYPQTPEEYERMASCAAKIMQACLKAAKEHQSAG